MHSSARTQKRYFNNRIKQQTFIVGQFVWMYWPLPRIRSTCRKLTKLWTGPWEILAFLSPLVVQVRHTTTRKRQTVHIDRLVPCVSCPTTEQPTGNQSAPVPHPDEHQNIQPRPTSNYSDNVQCSPAIQFSFSVCRSAAAPYSADARTLPSMNPSLYPR